ncbi:carbohydrate ABC transporter permease [Bauldia litoralis]|uniref:Multiple sugar transport system permease protein n=1 Tax=Bauldia litoralis TaxID=665467 RepID=A0A1G6BVB0_9HYPH|nr:sugar ABC transporter permease [Bauldia litoralis]SDB24539.1 multiple sugar transport system permease protein [Bauldia litoralis]
MARSSSQLTGGEGLPGGPIARAGERLGERGALALFLVPALAVIAVAQFYPLVESIIITTHDWTLARSPVMGRFVGLDNYARALTDPQFVGSTGFTLLLAVGSTVISLAFGLGLALLTVGEGFHFRLSRTLLMLPMVIAPVAVGTMWRMILAARVGPLNQALAGIGIDGPNWLGDPNWAAASVIIVDAWQWTPFVTIVMAAALASLPADVLRAAEVDGAGRWTIFRRIVFPMILPVFLLVAMFRAIDALMTLDIIFTTTGGGPGFATQTLSFWIYQQGLRYFNISYAAAASWILLAGCLVVAAGFLVWRSRISGWQRERGA